MTSARNLFQIVFLFMAIVLIACSSPESEAESKGIQSILPKEAAKMFSSGEAVIIDVREKNEWDEKHIPGAIHIPLAQLNNHLPELEKFRDKPVITQCRSGRRSAQAAVMLKNAGFKDIYNLEGGIIAWEKEGLELEK